MAVDRWLFGVCSLCVAGCLFGCSLARLLARLRYSFGCSLWLLVVMLAVRCWAVVVCGAVVLVIGGCCLLPVGCWGCELFGSLVVYLASVVVFRRLNDHTRAAIAAFEREVQQALSK